jgi:predicted CoA-binding protein
MAGMNEPALIQEILITAKIIAVIGATDSASKPSHFVPAYLQQQGYRVVPVNPSVESVLGEKSYVSLTELVAAGIRPDVVDIFRLPKFIPAIVDEMLTLGLDNLWIQSGIINEQAAAKAEAGGIHVVMDHCIMVEHRHLRPTA